MSVQISVSIGELLDKYSILEIKRSKIKEIAKVEKVETEIQHLLPFVANYIGNECNVAYEYKLLKYINVMIWDFNEDAHFFKWFNGKDIMDLNNARFRIKKWINEKSISIIQEVKSYNPTSLYIRVNYGPGYQVKSLYAFVKWKLLFNDLIYIIVDKNKNDPTILEAMCTRNEDKENIRIITEFPKGVDVIDVCYEEVPHDFFEFFS
jgi:hypothetical protein